MSETPAPPPPPAVILMDPQMAENIGSVARVMANFGLSDLRIVGILGTTLVVVGVLLVAHKLRAQRTLRWLVRRQLDTFALTFALYALLPTHFIAAHVNVARIGAGESGPLMHLGPQASHVESVAVLLPLLDHPDPRVREGVASLLETQLECLGCELVDRTSWRQEDLLTRSVHAQLLAARPRIDLALASADPHEARRALERLGHAAADDWGPAELATISRAPRVEPITRASAWTEETADPNRSQVQ